MSYTCNTKAINYAVSSELETYCNNKYTKRIIVSQSPILMYDLRDFLIKDVILALKISLIVKYQSSCFERQKI